MCVYINIYNENLRILYPMIRFNRFVSRTRNRVDTTKELHSIKKYYEKRLLKQGELNTRLTC